MIVEGESVVVVVKKGVLVSLLVVVVFVVVVVVFDEVVLVFVDLVVVVVVVGEDVVVDLVVVAAVKRVVGREDLVVAVVVLMTRVNVEVVVEGFVEVLLKDLLDVVRLDVDGSVFGMLDVGLEAPVVVEGTGAFMLVLDPLVVALLVTVENILVD